MSVSIDYTGGVFKANKAKKVGTVTAGTGPYNLASASYDSKSYNTNSQDSLLADLFFKPDGTKLYTIGLTNDRVYQHSLSTAWDISTASYDSVFFSFSGQVSSGNGAMSLHFKPDGTKMYIVDTGSSSGDVNSPDGFIDQYNLSTAWDISTASYSNVRATVAVSNNSGSTFSRDGTKFYVVGQNASNQTRTLQYNLSTAFDLSTVSFSNNEFNHTSQDSAMVAMHISSDGTKMWMVGYNTDNVYRYSLSTAFDISTASYDSVSFSVASQMTIPYGLTFKDDGVKMYVADLSGDTIYQYSTGTATTLDLSTGNYFSHTPSVNTLFAFNNPPASGTAAGFALALTGANVAETYDIANASYDSVSLNIATEEPIPTGLTFSADGTNAYIAGPNNDTVYQYSLSTAWDLSTASYASKSLSVSGQALLSGAIQFKDDGTSLYVLDRNLDDVFQYDLTTAWDVSTASYASKSMDATSQDTAPRGMYFKPDGTKVYIAGDTNNSIYQYALSTAWDISTGSFETGKSFSVNTQTTYPCGVYINSNGDKMWVASTTDGYIYQYSLSTAWDVSTASYDSVSFDASTQVTTGLHDLYFKSDGSKMYLISNSTDAIFQYTTQATSAATFTYPSSVKFPSGTAPAGPAIGETDVLVFYTDDGGTTYQGFRAGDAMA